MKIRGLKRLLSLACVVALSHSMPVSAQPNDFLSKPIRIVVPAAPGGATDNVARSLAKAITDQTQAVVFVENKAGASGAIGIMQVVNSKADGYTLLISAVDGIIIYPLVRPDAPYRYEKDLTPISLTGDMHFAYTVNAESKFKTLKEFIEASKVKQLTYSSPGTGTSGHLCGEILRQRTGANLLHVPYNGASPAMVSVAAKETDMVCTTPTTLRPMLDSGKLRALASTNETRTNALPGVPTMTELGYSDFVVHPWNGIFAPRDMDPAIADQLNKMINNALDSDEFRKTAAKLGMKVRLLTRPEFEAKLKKESDLWGKTVQSMGSTIQKD